MSVDVKLQDGAPVTVCPPGKRAGGKLRGPVDSPIPYSTDTSLVMPKKPSVIPSAKGDRRPIQERIDAAEEEDAMSVALSQPHRRDCPDAAEARRAGSVSSRLSEPLGRLCARLRLRDELWYAGGDYAKIVRAAKMAKEFDVIGLSSSDTPGEPLSEKEIEAKRIKALTKFEQTNEVLRAVMPRLPRAMERLCYDQLEPAPRDESLLKHGLLVLAVDFGLLKRGINAEKGI